jgi:acyl-CoA synthetase (AMP-forming)/AMP-acid ligase II
MKIPLSPMEFARRARRLYGDRQAVVDGDLSLSYAEFLSRCDQWSSTLQTWGIGRGDRVAYLAPNTHAQLESFYAVPQIGAVLVPINYRLSPDEFAYIVNHSGARVLCVHADFLRAVDGIRSRIAGVEQFVALEGATNGWIDYEAALSSASAAVDPVALDEDDLISINYTSGTTARPKGVMITHRNAFLNVMGILAHESISPADRYLWTLPMFHANGWGFVWAITARGGTHICLRRVDPRTVFESIASEGVTRLCAAPTVLIGLANAPADMRAGAPRGVRLITAGAPPAAATIERIEHELGWRLTQAYGLTETSPFISICEERPEHATLTGAERSVVKARQGVELVSSGELMVVNANGEEVPHDGESMGEIRVRGNVVMKGYFNDPEATSAAIRDGWFYSGDVAVVHPDGYAEIRDRRKDVIISGGENISSVEVESVLLRHPAVQEVAIVGMPHPKWGEAPHAFVVLRRGESASEEALKQFVRDRLAHFKTPQWVSFIDELPKTATGKIQKYVLRGRSSAIAPQ